MTQRDRTVLIVVGMLGIVAAFWFLAISPKRKDASALNTQVQAAQTRLDTANAAATSAGAAKAKYSSDYSTVAQLGKSVPVDDDVPSLVYQLQHAAAANHIDLRQFKMTGTSTAAAAPTGVAAAVASTTTATPSSTASTSSSASTTTAATTTAALPPGATVGTAGFPTMPFAFDLTGSFSDMNRFLHAVNNLTQVNSHGILVRGRLLSTDGVVYKAGPKGFPDIEATMVVTSYLLPADEGLTAGATAPTGTTAASSGSSTATASLIQDN
jgi:Tfp pilus assembly protein PilO